jgi:hypothetical protein
LNEGISITVVALSATQWGVIKSGPLMTISGTTLTINL